MLYYVVKIYVVHKLIAKSGHPEHLQELLLTATFSKKWKNNFKVLTQTSKNLISLFKFNENKRETLSYPLNNNDLHNYLYKWLCSVLMKAESKKWCP